jgi:glutathione S-transferase
MKLFYAPAACSLSPHIALREAGAKFTLEKVDLQTKKTETAADFLANPALSRRTRHNIPDTADPAVPPCGST